MGASAGFEQAKAVNRIGVPVMVSTVFIDDVLTDAVCYVANMTKDEIAAAAEGRDEAAKAKAHANTFWYSDQQLLDFHLNPLPDATPEEKAAIEEGLSALNGYVQEIAPTRNRIGVPVSRGKAKNDQHELDVVGFVPGGVTYKDYQAIMAGDDQGAKDQLSRRTRWYSHDQIKSILANPQASGLNSHELDAMRDGLHGNFNRLYAATSYQGRQMIINISSRLGTP